jgi:hypothetical protein
MRGPLCRPDAIKQCGLVMKTITATCLTLLLGAGPAFAADQYLCITEAVAGLHYDRQTKQWSPMAFKPGDKYMVYRFTGKQREAYLGDPEFAKYASIPNLEAWGIRKFGDNSGPNVTACITASGDGDCGEGTLPFGRRGSLDLNSLRFELILTDAYMAQGRDQYLKQTNPQEYQKRAKQIPSLDSINRPDDLAIEIGGCSPLN